MVVVGLALWALLHVRHAAAQSRGGDHPLISRFPGSEVRSSATKEFDQLLVPVGPVRRGQFARTERLEGKTTRIVYANPAGRSTLEIFRAYQQALAQAGFQTLFTCGGGECGDAGTNDNFTDVGRWCVAGIDCAEPMRYLAAKLSRPDGDVYVAVKVLNNAFSTAGTTINIVEIRPASGLTRPSPPIGLRPAERRIAAWNSSNSEQQNILLVEAQCREARPYCRVSGISVTATRFVPAR